jgi:hypothetical protein
MGWKGEGLTTLLTPVGNSFARFVLGDAQTQAAIFFLGLVRVAWLESSWQMNGLSINTR